VLHCCYTVVTLLLHCCYTVVTLWLLCGYTVVTLWLHCCYTVVTLLSHCCHTVVTLLSHCCHTVVTLLSHCCCTAVTLLLHCCYTYQTACLLSLSCTEEGSTAIAQHKQQTSWIKHRNDASHQNTSECYDVPSNDYSAIYQTASLPPWVAPRRGPPTHTRTMLLHCFYTFYTVVTLLLHSCQTVVTQLLHLPDSFSASLSCTEEGSI
jgi:hypothetical protein